MAQDRIDSFYDLEELKRNREAALQIVREGTKAIIEEQEKVKGSTASPTAGGLGAGSKQVKELSDAIKSLVAIQKEEIEVAAKMRELAGANSAARAKEREEKKAIADDRKLEMANTKEVLALKKEVARQEAELRKLEIAGSKEALAIQKELAKQKELLVKAEIAQSKEAERQKAADRKLEIAGAKEALAIQKELDKQRKAQLAAQSKEAVEIAKAEKNAINLSNAEQVLILKIKEKEAAYKQSFLTLGAQSAQTIKLKDETNALKDTQNKMNTAIGNYGSNVGNYSSAWNGLGMSIQQVAREMPNFAQSAQLGFLAISNNLPILADELTRAKDNIKALKAEGKDAPSLFSQIAKSVFSWQTLLTIGITLLVKYGAEISNWVMSVSDAEKTIRSYEKALTDTIKSESDGISKLVAAKAAINDNSTSRERQIELYKDIQKQYPEYLSSLDLEAKNMSEINRVISEQIELRLQNARETAAAKTLSESTTELVLAYQDLNKENDSYFSDFVSYFKIMNVGYEDLTDNAKKLLDVEKQKLIAMGETTISNTFLAKIVAISEAEKKQTAAVEKSLSPLNEKIDALNLELKAYEKKEDAIKRDIVGFDSINKKHKIERENIQSHILLLKLQIQSLNESAEAKRLEFAAGERKLKGGADELELIKIKSRVLAAKNGSKEEMAYKESQIQQQLIIDKKLLAAEYKGGYDALQMNKEFIERRKLLEVQANDDIEKLRDSFNKKAAKAAKDALPKKDKFIDEKEAIAAQKAIAENEEMTYKQRYDAAVKFSELSQELLKKEGKSTTDNLIITATETDKLLKKINDDKEKERLEDLKRAENYSKELARIILEQTNNIQENENAAREKELSELADNLSKRKISLRQYNIERLRINDKYDGIILQNQKDALMDYLKEEKLQPDEIAKIQEKITDITNKQSENRIHKVEDEAQKKKALKDKEFEYEKQLAQELQNFIFQLLDERAQREIDNLEKKKQKLSEDYALEASAVDRAGLLDTEKTKQKIVLAEEEKEKQKQIDKEIGAIRRKQAIYDKAQALATIAINTAVAASAPTNLALGGILTPLIIALGAVQAAAVLATPLPEYAKGKKATDSYEGLAIAGEKGTEMKIDKDGKLQLLTEPTLISTKRGDTILSNAQLKSGELGKHIKTESQKTDYNELIKAYSYHTDRTIKAIKNSPSNVIIDNSNYNLNLKRARA